MDGTSLLLAERFSDMPAPQTTLYTKKIKAAQDRSFFFYNFSDQALSHLRNNTIYLNDSLPPKYSTLILISNFKHFMGFRVKISCVQLQKNNKDCGCFTVAFCVSLMFGDNSANQCYNQKEMRSHIIQCFEEKCFAPFPATLKKSKIPPPLEIPLDG